MRDRNATWMFISGLTGFIFFLIANFTTLFHGSAVIAGILQLAVNGFVFMTWSKGFAKSHGFKKFIKFCGSVVPVVMAGITIWRVLFPAFLQFAKNPDWDLLLLLSKIVVICSVIVWCIARRVCNWCSERRQREQEGRCIECGYDLGATPDLCPECGTARQQ